MFNSQSFPFEASDATSSRGRGVLFAIAVTAIVILAAATGASAGGHAFVRVRDARTDTGVRPRFQARR